MSGKTISVNSQVLRWNEVLNRWSLSELEVDNNTIDLYNTEEGILETYASILSVNTSIPVSAVILLGKLITKSESIIATLGVNS